VFIMSFGGTVTAIIIAAPTTANDMPASAPTPVAVSVGQGSVPCPNQLANKTTHSEGNAASIAAGTQVCHGAGRKGAF